MSIIIFPYVHAIIVLCSYAPSLPSLAIHMFKKIYFGGVQIGMGAQDLWSQV